MRRSLVMLAMFGVAAGPNASLAPWGTNPHPTDVPKRHAEKIVAGRHAYTVRQGGTMDGANCRSPIGVGMSDGPAADQTWESNRAVRLENTGETDVVNPWLANGRNGFRTLDEIVASAVKPGMTDREKAHALWFQQIRHRYHWAGDNNELGDPVKVFNIYGHNTCGNDSICLAGLWKRAGLKVTPAHVVGHCVTQCFFDGRWNLFDGDMHSMYLLRDNQTVACEQDLVRDHDLIKRTHTQGILNPDRRANDEWEASIYMFDGPPAGDRNCAQDTSMNMVLRPGEALTWRWGHASPVKYHGQKPRYPGTICNGLWEYRPDFSRALWQKGAASVQGVQAKGGELVAEEGKTGTIVWIIRSPYVLVGGKLETEGSGAKFSLSWDGKSWLQAGPDLDKFFPADGPARYAYRLRCELDAGARLKRLRIVNDIQMAPLALPAMSVGDNQFVYTDQSPGERQVRITHDWVERSASLPPEAPAGPTLPPDKGEAEGTQIVFRWPAPANAGGDTIADYHFELSDRPDMSWPLSPNFYKLISKTADRGKSQYTLPHSGLLAVDRKYYWRVRAKNDKGVWGPWSTTWSFTPRGPSSPIDVSLAVDRDRGTGILRWKPNATGRKPAKYRIYGSDEKGFTVSDEPYKATVGVSKVVSSNRPANYVTEVSATEAAVIGAEIHLPNANRAYYRVVAVDEKGDRSGSSDFAEAPRPLLWSRPITVAQVGSPYHYALGAIRSLGDLRTRVVDGKETMNYWDIENPRFALQQGPAWLKIDERTGVLSGVPESAGNVVITVTATIDREVRKLDVRALSWGQEKTLSTGTQRVGAATQTFTLEIHPDALHLRKVAQIAAEAKLDNGRFDAATQKQLQTLVANLTDAQVRRDTEQLLPTLEEAAARHANDRLLLAEIKRLGGKATSEVIAPKWLRSIAGDEHLPVFGRLVEIDLNERTDGHKEPTPKKLSDRVSDAWLKNLAGQDQLRRLEVSGTAITSNGLVHLKALGKIEWLNVCLTAVDDRGFEHLAGMTAMRRMVVCSSKITGTGFKHLQGMKQIESINLHSSPASDAGLEAIGKLTSLRRLEIVHTNVTDGGLKHLAGLTNLQQLHIHGPAVTATALPFLGQLKELYQLDVYDRAASNQTLEQIARLPKLRLLMLTGGIFDDDGVKHLAKLTTLEELSLDSSHMTEAAIDHLTGLQNLRKLHLGRLKIGAAGRQRLRATLPNAVISP